MGLYEASSVLAKSHKDLLLKWQLTKTQWDDPQALEIEKETLVQLDRDIRQAAEAMDTMMSMVGSARRDCSDY